MNTDAQPLSPMTADRLIAKGKAYFQRTSYDGHVRAYVVTRSIAEAEHYPRASQLNNQPVRRRCWVQFLGRGVRTGRLQCAKGYNLSNAPK